MGLDISLLETIPAVADLSREYCIVYSVERPVSVEAEDLLKTASYER